jgi:hypothetical protein
MYLVFNQTVFYCNLLNTRDYSETTKHSDLLDLASCRNILTESLTNINIAKFGASLNYDAKLVCRLGA